MVNLTHLHLVLNHVPTVGSAVALGLLLLGIIRRHEPLKHVGLEALFAIAVLTLPVYMTGVAAHLALKTHKEVSDTAMRVHQDAALLGFTVTEFAGFVAWLALWQSRRRGRAARGLVPAVTLLTVISLALMGRAANLGGEIRHPEILTAAAADAATAPAAPAAPAAAGADDERFVASAISTYMVYSPWAWPAAETVHFLGLSLTFGVLLAVNLRILGLMKHVAFADVHRLLPWGMLGFGANLITGMIFFVGQPGQYVGNGPFYWKIVILMVSAANFLYLTVFRKPWEVDRLEAGLADKAMAITSIVAWLAILYAGRMLPFIGHAF